MNKNTAEYYKPLIDEAILQLVKYNEGQVEEAREILKGLKTNTIVEMENDFFNTASQEGFLKFMEENASEISALGYLKKSMYKLKKYLNDGKLKPKLENEWINVLFEPGRYFDDSEESIQEIRDNLVLKNYPQEGWEALQQEDYLVVEDADFLGVWKRSGRESIYHAHPEGFWVLGDDPVDWIEKVVSKVYTS